MQKQTCKKRNPSEGITSRPNRACPKPERPIWITPESQSELDNQFMERVQREVSQSCSLPFSMPADRIPDMIIQAAQWFWENVDSAMEERDFAVMNRDICKHNALNKIIKLPQQIYAVTGVYKIQQDLRYGTTGDFSLERMLMSSYSMFGGAGMIGGGFGLSDGSSPYTLKDAIISLYEVDTFDQYLNPPVTFNFNRFSSKLILIGDIGRSDLVIETFVRCRIQDLYNSYHFFRWVVCLCKKALGSILGAFEFTLPGGISINYSMFRDDAESEMSEIKEWAENNRASSYFLMPNTM